MLRGRSDNDSVLPTGDNSREASCVGMLLERVIRGGPPMGLRTGERAEKERLGVTGGRERDVIHEIHH